MNARAAHSVPRLNRFNTANDGRDFRRYAFGALSRRYRAVILRALGDLQQLSFEFPSLDKVHAEQLRPELVFRHALPFCLTEEAYFGVSESSHKVLAALLAGHTLALTQLDYHLDGSDPEDRASATARKVDMATSVAYAIRMIYAMGRMAEQYGCGALFQEVFDPVSGFVVSRMYQDWCDRYSAALLDSTLEEYLSSPKSRLLGSGYWEVMVRGVFAGHNSTPPEGVIRAVRALRQLRQLIDEIADFDDDIEAGLVTAPLLFALHGDEIDRGKIVDAVQAFWQARPRKMTTLKARVTYVRDLVDRSGAFRMAAEYAHDVWRNEVNFCVRNLGPEGRGLVVLLDLKRAKLAELESAGWHNRRTGAFLA